MTISKVKHYTQEPYYDDYDETKNYHRVLFQPGFAVQARELTQMQTALQAQLDRFGQWAFADGSAVVGGKCEDDLSTNYIKIEDVFQSTLASGSAASHTTSAYIAEFVGTTITGRDNTGNQVKFKVSAAYAAGVGPAHTTNTNHPITLYGHYVASGGPNKTVGVFGRGETFFSDAGTVRYGKVQGENAASSTEYVGTTAGTNSALTDNSQTGTGSFANITEGVYFISGSYVYVPSTSLVLDKYTNTPSYRIGLKVSENIVTSTTDSDLVDNAQGVPNTSAPGAHRYQISTTLIAEPLNIDSRTTNNYIALFTIENGIKSFSSLNVKEKTERSDELARRTFDESGNYTVNPFVLDIKEHLNDGSNFGFKTSSEGGSAGKFAIGVGENKAYVQGYEIKTPAGGAPIEIDKPRANSDKAVIAGASTLLEVGNYVKLTASTVRGIPDVTTQIQMNLRNSSNANIGTARAKGLEWDGTTYRLFLYDIQMNSSQVFGSVTNVTQDATEPNMTQGFAGTLNPAGTRYESGKESLVYKLPFDVIAEDGHSSTWTYNVRIKVATTAGSGAAEFGLPSGCKLANNDDIQVAVNGNATVEATSVASGINAQNFTLNSSNISGTISNGDKVQAIVTAKVTNARRRTKQLQIGTTLNITANGSAEYTLGKTDVIKLTSLTNGGIDYKDKFILDDGQQESYYDVAKIVLKGGESIANGTYVATFDHYTHNAGDFFDTNSYQAVYYTRIPTFNSSQGLLNLRDCVDFRSVEGSGSPTSGKEMSTGTDFSSALPPAPDGIFAHTLTQVYMPRLDKLSLSKEGKFKYQKGNSSLNPVAPEDSADAMTLYTISVAPYVFDMKDIKPIPVDNKRYTMRDIGRLDKRLKNLEYYTSLSLLESSASTLFPGRFKSGFVVDGFHGHGVGNPATVDYSCSIDKDKGILRPKFDERIVNMVRTAGDQAASLSVASQNAGIDAKAVSSTRGGLVTLPHTSQQFIKQPYATYAEFVNPYNVFVWEGSVKLSPDSDVWKEVDVRPDIIIDDNSVYDQFVAMAEEAGILGTVWNEWETNWTGTETTSTTTQLDVDAQTAGQLGYGDGSGRRRAVINQTTTATTETGSQSRSGTTTSVASDTQYREVGSYVVETNFIPFMRSRKIYFDAEALKPDTKLYAFFGGTNITAYARQEVADSSAPYLHAAADFVDFSSRTLIKTYEDETEHPDATSGGSTRGSLVTDASGRCIGSFILPRNSALKFKTGSQEFKLTDSSTNAETADGTKASATYYAQGLLEVHQKTIIATKIPRLVTREIREDGAQVERTRRTTENELVKWYDPLAQTFTINHEVAPDGIFARSLDLFFAAADAALPINVSIRSVENGYPTQSVLPGAEKWVYPTDINTHATGNTATTITWDHPVFLDSGQEYAIVLIANSDVYKVWVSEMGAFDIADQTKRIVKQPYNGVFFTSANASTWTAEQTKDLKFTFNRCKFTGDKAEMILNNDRIPVKKLGASPFEYLTATTIRVSHPNHNMYGNGTNKVEIAGFSAENGITDVSKINKLFTLANNLIEHDSYVITHTGSATTTGIVGGGNEITATEDQQYNILKPVMQTLELPGTSIDLHLTAREGASQDGGASAWNAVLEQQIMPNKNFVPDKTYAIAGKSQEDVIGAKSLILRAVLNNGGNDFISPVIDMERCEVVAVSNRINDPSGAAAQYSANSRLVAETNSTGTGGTAISKYITRQIDLAEEASKLDVYLGINRPTGSNIDVYYRVQPSGSDSNFHTIPWVQLSSDKTIPINDARRFSEVHYAKDFGSTDKFGSFAIKIVFRSTNSNNVPLVTDLRALATT